jgi:hypothetical protein
MGEGGGVTKDQIVRVMNEAARQWANAKPRQRVVRFTIDGRAYKSRRTLFRMFVEAADGQPVAYRFW